MKDVWELSAGIGWDLGGVRGQVWMKEDGGLTLNRDREGRVSGKGSTWCEVTGAWESRVAPQNEGG